MGLLATGLVAVPFVGIVVAQLAPAVESHLPVAAFDLGASFVRMLLAYGLALGFSLSYGYVAATRRSRERVMIPVLDVLQSVPILGFFPVAIVVIVALTGPNSWVGPNLASIFLIFTSMSWNMVFGVYESVKSVPSELQEAADSFGVHGTQRFRQLFVPATVNRLVYNSVLSWSGGWYFLVAAEIITTSSTPNGIVLPGIGSYLVNAAGSGDAGALVAGIVLLVAVIALLDVFVWRPLGRFAERFRYDQAPSGEGAAVSASFGAVAVRPLRRAAGYVARGVRASVSRIRIPFVSRVAPVPEETGLPRTPSERWNALLRLVLVGAILVLVWLLLIALVVDVFNLFTSPIGPVVRGQIEQVPAALGLSFGRVVLAYIVSVLGAVPLAILLARRPRVATVGLPVVEVVASIPATALFPLFIFTLAGGIGFQGAAILMLTTGMVWYIFFNTLSGLRAIPPDLEEAARSFHLSRREYYRRLIFPAIFPSLITGSITAFGGGWNTLIIAEYLQYGNRQLTVLGLGELIQIGNSEAGGYALLAVALFTLVLAVVGLNELLWKPLYRRAIERYRMD